MTPEQFANCAEAIRAHVPLASDQLYNPRSRRYCSVGALWHALDPDAVPADHEQASEQQRLAFRERYGITVPAWACGADTDKPRSAYDRLARASDFARVGDRTEQTI